MIFLKSKQTPISPFQYLSMNSQAFTIENGRYQIIGKLGEGGMAAVFRVYDTLLKVERAVKVLSPEYARHKQIRERFVVEASTMARLHHKNIVMVHDIKPEGTPVYMIMEMLKGGSLMDRVEDFGVLHPQQAIDATIATVEGLGFAHKNKVIHRDVKPHNVLLDENGIPKVTDFGIARLEDDQSSKTKTGAVMGTFAYMAPEQRISARRATGQSDLYAAGASMFVLLTNANPAEIFVDEMQDRLMEGFDPHLKEFIAKSCAFNAKERFIDSEDMVKALYELKKKVEPLPKDFPPMFISDCGLQAMKEISDKEISDVHDEWHTFCNTTPPPRNHSSGSTVETMAFDAMMNENPSSKTVGLDFLSDPENEEEVSQTIMPVSNKGGSETIIESHSPQAPPQPKSSKALLFIGLGVVGLGVGGGLYTQNQKPNPEPTPIEQAIVKATPEPEAPPEPEVKAEQTTLSNMVPGIEGKDQKTILAVLGTPTWVIQDNDNPKSTDGENTDENQWILEENTSLMWVWKNSTCPPIQISFTLKEDVYSIVSINDGWSDGKADCILGGDYSSSKLPPDDFLCTEKKRTKLCEVYVKPKQSVISNTNNATPTPTPASNTTGTFKVNSRPYSTISLDGQVVGSKLLGEYPTGQHQIKMKTADGREKKLTLTVREGQETQFCWDFDQETECTR